MVEGKLAMSIECQGCYYPTIIKTIEIPEQVPKKCVNCGLPFGNYEELDKAWSQIDDTFDKVIEELTKQ